MKYTVGFVGWRGMVGSVLINRMIEKKDFEHIKPFFLTTSQKNGTSPKVSENIPIDVLYDAYNLDLLKSLDIIVTCQGSKYTNDVYYKLRKINWTGYWIDASSLLRMSLKTLIVLDPINLSDILLGIEKGIKTFVGGNCTVSLMLMSLSNLFKENLIDWVSVSTYQAVSGGGSKCMNELFSQIQYVNKIITEECSNVINVSPLVLEKKITEISKSLNFSDKYLKNMLVHNLIPWIDVATKDGQSKEEWKGSAETNKILNSNRFIPIDGVCVRIDSFRCHSQAFTIKLLKNISIKEIYNLLNNQHPWIKIVDNTPEETIKYLNPISVSGSLNVSIGRLRKLTIGDNYLSAFSVGDQLLWGAAEPLRRILKILIS